MKENITLTQEKLNTIKRLALSLYTEISKISGDSPLLKAILEHANKDNLHIAVIAGDTEAQTNAIVKNLVEELESTDVKYYRINRQRSMLVVGTTTFWFIRNNNHLSLRGMQFDGVIFVGYVSEFMRTEINFCWNRNKLPKITNING
jgi:hypothetical protein